MCGKKEKKSLKRVRELELRRARIVDTIKVFSNRFLTVVLSKIQSKIISSDSESSDWENSKNEIGNLIIDLDASINQSRKKGTAVEKENFRTGSKWFFTLSGDPTSSTRTRHPRYITRVTTQILAKTRFMPSGATKSYFYVNIYFLNFAKIVMNTLVQAKKSSNLQKIHKNLKTKNLWPPQKNQKWIQPRKSRSRTQRTGIRISIKI